MTPSSYVHRSALLFLSPFLSRWSSHHGLRKEAIHKVTEVIIGLMSRILYAAPTWWGLTQISVRLRIDNLQRKLQGIEYTSHA